MAKKTGEQVQEFPKETEYVVSKTPAVDKLRAELEQRKAELLAKLAPARKIHDEIVNDPRLIEARRLIKEVSPQLAQVENELAAVHRMKASTKSLKVEPGHYTDC